MQISQKNPLVAKFESHFLPQLNQGSNLAKKNLQELKVYLSSNYHYHDLIKASNVDAFTKHLFLHCIKKEGRAVKELIEKREGKSSANLPFDFLEFFSLVISKTSSILGYLLLGSIVYARLSSYRNHMDNISQSMGNMSQSKLLEITTAGKCQEHIDHRTDFLFCTLTLINLLPLLSLSKEKDKRSIQESEKAPELPDNKSPIPPILSTSLTTQAAEYSQIAADAFEFPNLDIKNRFCQTFKDKFLSKANSLQQIVDAKLEKVDAAFDYKVLKAMQDCILEAIYEAENYANKKYLLLDKILGAGGVDLTDNSNSLVVA